MKRSVVALNIVLAGILFFFLGGVFWLWQAKIIALLRPSVAPVLPPETSFRDTFVASSSVKTVPVDTVTSSPKEESPLPETMNLSLSFTSQAPEKNWEQPWQDACEEAAVLMMDAYYREYKLTPLIAKDEILKMVAWEEQRSWDRSIEIEKIQTIFDEYLEYRKIEKKIKIVENPTVQDIKSFLAHGQPVLAVADGKVLPNPHFQNGGPVYHALVIKGYTAEKFITDDPGTQFGENFQYTYTDLMDALRDWNGGDVKNGRRVVLVIE